ncbi:hypothetical protein MUK42_35605 [Musa troglodytarum]|uniref:Uncharacterized protein n=1 Tax=Musa troglodytarum TaxID=320322 RepID=A0A9E7JWV1_9LILI|nr:hypothetical protein MUK42_35605 [Musa troglodytarum]
MGSPMASPLPVLRLPLPTPPPFPSSSAAAQKPNPYAALPRSTVQWPMPNQGLTTGLRGFFRSNGGICLVPLAMSAAASVASDGSTRPSVGHIRKLFDGFPQPIKSFPWKRVISSFQNIILELVRAVAKSNFSNISVH